MLPTITTLFSTNSGYDARTTTTASDYCIPTSLKRLELSIDKTTETIPETTSDHDLHLDAPSKLYHQRSCLLNMLSTAGTTLQRGRSLESCCEWTFSTTA